MSAPLAAFKRILVPVDFSTRSANALEFAVAMGSLHHAEVDVLHVWHSDLATSVTVAKERAKNTLREFVASLQLEGDVALRRRIDHGDPYLTIQSIVRLSGHDLVVVAGPDGQRASEASVASSVLFSVPCAVLFVPPISKARFRSEPGHALNLERLLVPLALAGQGLGALDFAEALTGAERAVVEVLRTSDASPESQARLRARAPLERREEHVQAGEVIPAVLTRVRDAAFDLVVLSAERSPIGGRPLDSRHARVALSSPCPSLCLPG